MGNFQVVSVKRTKQTPVKDKAGAVVGQADTFEASVMVGGSLGSGVGPSKDEAIAAAVKAAGAALIKAAS